MAEPLSRTEKNSHKSYERSDDNMVKWQIKRGDKIASGISSNKVRKLAAAGKLKKTDLLCKEGTENWIAAGKAKGLWKTEAPSQTEKVLAKDQQKRETPVASSATSKKTPAAPAPIASQSANIQQESLPEQAPDPVPQQVATAPVPQQEETEKILPQEVKEPVPQQVTTEPVQRQEEIEKTSPKEVEEPVHQQEAAEPLPEKQAIVEESADSYVEPEEELIEEPYEDVPRGPRRKWLVPVVAGSIGFFLLFGLMSIFAGGQASQESQQSSVMRDSGQQQRPRARSNANSNLSLTDQFFPPNIAEFFQYTTEKFEANTTVPVYRKTIVEKWNTETELYFHEKGFRNFGQKVAYRVSDGYVQLKGKENWFRFLKLGAKVGDTWTPGDGEDGTLDWAGKGKIELFDFKTVDSVNVAIVEFTAKLELPVPSYLVPAGFDFGIMEDGSGPIEGKIRFELGDGLGILRADAIVPQGTRHRTGGGRDSSDWIFATRLRTSDTQEE